MKRQKRTDIDDVFAAIREMNPNPYKVAGGRPRTNAKPARRLSTVRQSRLFDEERERRDLNRRVLYFAYGSNLHVEQMMRRCPSAKKVGRASLPGWALVFRGPADITRSPMAMTHGAVWSITLRDIEALDRYEGHPFMYRRINVDVRVNGKDDARVFTYTMTRQRSREQMLPSGSYFRTVAQGYKAWGLNRKALWAAAHQAAEELVARGVTAEDLVEDGKRIRIRKEWK